ncbi:MAG: hypothetical protein U5R31_02025 [Acidimicrobiia bacterium]|nr:hypothetical protein [Acidimicrobiia bacterium]
MVAGTDAGHPRDTPHRVGIDDEVLPQRLRGRDPVPLQQQPNVPPGQRHGSSLAERRLEQEASGSRERRGSRAPMGEWGRRARRGPSAPMGVWGREPHGKRRSRVSLRGRRAPSQDGTSRSQPRKLRFRG